MVAIAHKLEAAPLNQALFPEREWARQWVLENPDVRTRMCLQLLPDLRRPRYKFRLEILAQMMLSSAAFLTNTRTRPAITWRRTWAACKAC